VRIDTHISLLASFFLEYYLRKSNLSSIFAHGNKSIETMDTAIVMNNLLNLIQSMALTPSNKRWLADHLYEQANEERQAKTMQQTAADWPKVKRSNIVISPKVANMFQVSEPLPEDYDVKKAYGEYLYNKYR